MLFYQNIIRGKISNVTYSWTTTSTNQNLSGTCFESNSVLNIVESDPVFIDSFMKEVSSNYALDSKFFKIYDNRISIKIFDTLIKTTIELSKEKSLPIYSDLLSLEKIGEDYILSEFQTQKDVVSIFSLSYTNTIRSNNVLINNYPLYTGLIGYIGMVYMPNKSVLIIDKTCYINLGGKIIKKKFDNYNDLIEIFTKYNINYNGIFTKCTSF